MCGEQAVPSTEKAAKFVLIIKVLLVLQLAIAILDIVAQFLREGIIGLFLPLLLFAGFYKLSHQAMMIYTFMSLFFSVMFLVYIMQTVQHSQNIEELDRDDRFYFVVACISLSFYILTSFFSFYPYREFKSIQFAENPTFANFDVHQQGSRDSRDDYVGYNDPPQYEVPPKDNKKTTYQVFQGQGVRIG